MASRLKIPGFLLLACAGVWLAVGRIEPKPAFTMLKGPPADEVTRLRAQAAQLATTIRRIAVADTVEKLLSTSSESLIVSGVTPRLVVVKARALLGDSADQARVVLVTVSPGHVSATSNTYSAVNMPAVEFLFGSDSGRPWCAAAHYSGPAVFGDVRVGTAERELRMLGPCRFWARYGEPGPEIRSWLMHGGYRFTDAAASFASDSEFRRQESRRLFGMRMGWSARPLSGDRCLTGRKGSCAAVVIDSVRVRRWFGREALPEAPPAIARDMFDDEAIGPADAAMFARLEEQFGRTRFQAFWHSAQPIEPAFEAAFGVSLDDWVRGWARSMYGSVPLAARVPMSTLLLSLLSIGVLLGLAVRSAQRRQVH